MPYYISFSTGSDSNNGTSKTTPWQRHPYMQKFAGKYTHAAGDQFVFKQGDSWPNVCFDMVIQDGGTAGNPDIYTYDPTWGTAAGVLGLAGLTGLFQFTAGGVAIKGADGFNRFIYNTNDNVVFYGIEFSGMTWTTDGGAFGNVMMIDMQSSANVTVSNCYFHGWTHSGATSDALMCVVGHDGGNAGSRVTGCVFDGLNSGGPGISDSGCATFKPPLQDLNIVRNMSNGLLYGANAVIHDNLVGPIPPSFDTTNHQNCFESIEPLTAGTTSTNYIYNNVWHDAYEVGILTQGGAPGSGVETNYIWNNVAYVGSSANPPIPFQFDSVSTSNSKCEVHIWNNTVVGGAGVCMRTISRGNGNFGVLDIQNNHCISDVAGPNGIIELGVSATTLVNSNNLLQTQAVAAKQGYAATEPFAYSPILGGSTIGAGLNLLSKAIGLIATLAQDTTYAGSRPTIARPTSGAWDIGAYEFHASGAPAPPTNVMIGTID